MFDWRDQSKGKTTEALRQGLSPQMMTYGTGVCRCSNVRSTEMDHAEFWSCIVSGQRGLDFPSVQRDLYD